MLRGNGHGVDNINLTSDCLWRSTCTAHYDVLIEPAYAIVRPNGFPIDVGTLKILASTSTATNAGERQSFHWSQSWADRTKRLRLSDQAIARADPDCP